MRYEKSSALNVLFRPISISERFNTVKWAIQKLKLFPFLPNNKPTLQTERERKRKRERERQRETEKQSDRDRERERQRDMHGQRNRTYLKY